MCSNNGSAAGQRGARRSAFTAPWTTYTARKEAERLLMLVRQGIDPVEEAREKKRKEKVLNFSSYCDQFVELYLQSNWID